MADRQGEYTVPEVTKADHVHTGARAVIASIPLIGDAAVELFSAVLPTAVEKRRDEWMERVGEGLQKLEEQEVLKVEDLGENEIFLDSIMQASQAALKTSEAVKREALKNAVLNSAKPSCPSAAKAQTFVRWIEEMNEWHLKLLKLFSGPEQWFAENGKRPLFMVGSTHQLVTKAFPELAREREFTKQILAELDQRELASLGGEMGMHAMGSADSAMQKRTTKLGDEFLQFITE